MSNTSINISIKKSSLVMALLSLFAILLIFNSMQITGLASVVNQKISTAQEEARPAEIEIITLQASECTNCVSLENELQKITAQNVNIKNQKVIELNSSEGQELVRTHALQQLPALIISGETQKNTRLENFWKNVNGIVTDNGTVILESTTAPFWDIRTEKTKGLVQVIQLTAEQCPECSNLTPLLELLTQNGVVIQLEQPVDLLDSKARELIDTYTIRQAPAILFSNDIEAYPAVLEQLMQLNVQEKNGYYPVHSMVPPYVDVNTGKTQGLVEVIYLTDYSCSDCYDVNVNKNILQRFGVFIANERTVDINSIEGTELIQQYQIEKVPVILLSPDASAYATFAGIWSQVGSLEDNGWYVMRSPEVIGTYKEISTGNVINPQAQAPSE